MGGGLRGSNSGMGSKGMSAASGSANRCCFSGGVQKPVSTIPKGPQMDCSRNTPRRWPVTASITAPSTSVAWLYSQVEPG